MPSSAVASQSRSPRALRFLRQLVLRPVRRVVRGGAVDRRYESGMHVQPERARRVSVLGAEALATGREVEVAADAERHVLPLHALQCARAARMLSGLTADSCRSSRTPECSFLAPRRRRTNQDARPAALVTRRRVNRLSPSGAPPNSFSAQLSRSRPSAGPSGTLTGTGTPSKRRHSRSSAYMRFHADRRRPRSRPPTAPGALACKLPVGGPQAGAVMAGQVDESLHQERTVPVPLLEVLRNRAQAKAERREVPAGRAGSGSCRGRDADVALASPCPPRRPALQGAALERRTRPRPASHAPNR